MAFIAYSYFMLFIMKSMFLGIGVAMDAMAVAMSNGLKYKTLNKKRGFLVALIFALFQGLMPLFGYFISFFAFNWLFVYTAPVSFFILCFLGVKTILECFDKKKDFKIIGSDLHFKTILMQAFATSIDALSIGITLINLNLIDTILCVIIISIVTFVLCLFGVLIGKKFGTWMKTYAEILGGMILIIIGISSII